MRALKMKYLILIYGNQVNWEHPMFLRNPDFLAMPGEERDGVTREAVGVPLIGGGRPWVCPCQGKTDKGG
ncbi:MAG: hypothetical protein QOI21_1783 [Actinomycetota bacterium]|jgi:hypothetical protein|nr:hypothetical protein [Actinomycetota bacterium]